MLRQIPKYRFSRCYTNMRTRRWSATWSAANRSCWEDWQVPIRDTVLSLRKRNQKHRIVVLRSISFDQGSNDSYVCLHFQIENDISQNSHFQHTTATDIAKSIGVMFVCNKVKALGRQNKDTPRSPYGTKQLKIRTMQNDHSRKLTTMQAQYTTKAENPTLTKQYPKEVALMKTIISKVRTRFPYFREVIRMESVCRTVGFNSK